MKHALLFLLLLTGCATAPQVVVEPKIVEVPKLVVQRCIDAKDIPQPPKSEMKPKGDVQQKAAGAVADLQALDAYVAKLLALLNSCAS